MRRISIHALGLVALLLVGCGRLETYSRAEQPMNTPLKAGVGQQLWRITQTRDLPNAFGKADVFGRKVDAGYQELRFLGMEGDSIILLGYREQEIYSNETTMSRTGVGFVNIQNYGNTTTGTITSPPISTTQMLAPFEVLIKHDLSKDPSFTHSGVRINVQKAEAFQLIYTLSSE